MANSEDLLLVPWQSEFFQDPARYKVAVCGRRSGKTTVASAIIYTQSLAKPDQVIWYVAPIRQLAKKLMFERLCKMYPKHLVDSINKSDLEIHLTNGTEIVCHGSDNPDSLVGHGLHLLVLDEYQSQKEDVWWIVRPMLADYQADCIVIGTPRGFNHFHELWYRGWSANPEKGEKWSKWSSYQITTEEAGTIPQEEIEDAKNTMSVKQFAQEFCASFTSLSGVVYDEFSPEVHVRKDISLRPPGVDKQLALRIGMDFNVNPMTACIGVIVPAEFGFSGHKELWICHEAFLENSNTREMIKHLHTHYGEFGDKQHHFGMHKKVVYPDPSGKSRNTVAEQGNTNHTLLEQGGFMLMGHDKGAPLIADTVNEVNALLRNVNGDVRMYVHPRCANLIKTLTGLTYVDNAPDKKGGLDHMSDGMRYLVHNEFPINKEKRVRKRGLI